MAADNADLTFRVGLNKAQADKVLDDLERRINKTSSSRVDPFQPWARTIGAADRAVINLESRLRSLTRVAAGVVIGGAAVGAARGALDMAASYNGAAASLRLYSRDTREAVASQEELYRMAQRTRQSFSDTVRTYNDMQRAAVGYGTGGAMQMTETMMKIMAAGRSNGAGQAQIDGALLGFRQIQNSGRVQGDELNQMEAVPELGQALIAGLRSMGIIVNSLKQVSDKVLAGEMSAAQIPQAMLRPEAQAYANNMFSGIRPDVTSAGQMISNSVSQAFAKLDENAGITEAIVGLVNSLVSKLDDAMATGGGSMGRTMRKRIQDLMVDVAEIIDAAVKELGPLWGEADSDGTKFGTTILNVASEARDLGKEVKDIAESTLRFLRQAKELIDAIRGGRDESSTDGASGFGTLGTLLAGYAGFRGARALGMTQSAAGAGVLRSGGLAGLVAAGSTAAGAVIGSTGMAAIMNARDRARFAPGWQANPYNQFSNHIPEGDEYWLMRDAQLREIERSDPAYRDPAYRDDAALARARRELGDRPSLISARQLSGFAQPEGAMGEAWKLHLEELGQATDEQRKAAQELTRAAEAQRQAAAAQQAAAQQQPGGTGTPAASTAGAATPAGTPAAGPAPAARPSPITPGPAPNLSALGNDVAARVLHGEANGQGPEGMAAVAWVMRNRAQLTGKSLDDVARAPRQFEPWGNDATRTRLLGMGEPQYAEARRILAGVLDGSIADPTGGATHFLNPDLQRQLGRAQPSWAPEGQGQRIGQHVFYRRAADFSPGAPLDPNASTADRMRAQNAANDRARAEREAAANGGPQPAATGAALPREGAFVETTPDGAITNAMKRMQADLALLDRMAEGSPFMQRYLADRATDPGTEDYLRRLREGEAQNATDSLRIGKTKEQIHEPQLEAFRQLQLQLMEAQERNSGAQEYLQRARSAPIEAREIRRGFGEEINDLNRMTAAYGEGERAVQDLSTVLDAERRVRETARHLSPERAEELRAEARGYAEAQIAARKYQETIATGTQVGQGAGQTLADVMWNAAAGGKDWLASIKAGGAEISKLAYNSFFAKPLGDAFGSLGSSVMAAVAGTPAKGGVVKGQADSGGLWAAIGRGLGSMFGGSSSEAIGPAKSLTAPVGIVPSSGARESGGIVHAGRPYLVGEKGPEPFIPAVDGRVISADAARRAMNGGAGGVNQTININISTPSPAAMRESTGQLTAKIRDAAAAGARYR